MQIEKKLDIPATQVLGVSDAQTIATLDAKAAEPMVEVYFDSDPARDYVMFNADGSMTRVAYTVNINGAQWLIPAQQKTSIPRSVYEYLNNCIEQQIRAQQFIPARAIGNI